MEDFYQYFVHRLLHYGILYKKIHKIHHEFSAPFGIAAQYAHPLETLFLGLGFFLGPFLWVYYMADLHVITMAVWLAVRLLQVVDSHSGYDFPWVCFLSDISLCIIFYLFGLVQTFMTIIIGRLWETILLLLDGGIGFVEQMLPTQCSKRRR
jgi:sterol desaturase/sphingolipid hydroxylase (fatty acid hydroxylase superfamily)